jgi:3-oxoadipate enol-lactonase
MPVQNFNGANLHYDVAGAGQETIVFSHGLLMNGDMFQGQVDALGSAYRCITYDHRGQGRSEVTESGYDMDSLTEDAAALIRALDAAPCHFVGFSMGGFVGLRLAIRHPELLRSLVLLDTSAAPEAASNLPRYRLMVLVGRWLGFRPIAGRVMQIMFGQTFLADPARRAERERWKRHFIGLGRVGTARAARAVIEREGVSDRLETITTPTLILVGDEDMATEPVNAERLHEGIAGSQLVVVRKSGHTSSIEQPEIVTSALRDFLAGL